MSVSGPRGAIAMARHMLAHQASRPGYMVARLAHAEHLSAGWDTLANCYFQRRPFLTFLERHNPCGQRYYELREPGGELQACAIVYTLPIDLLTFAGVHSPVRAHFVGVPVSQSAPGLFGTAAGCAALLERLGLEEPRFLVGLNLDAPLQLPGLAEGRTLPTALLDRAFASFDDYLQLLRSDYRRRLLRIGQSFDGVAVERSGCDRFDAAMHRLYLDVYERSDAKLEQLGLGFFQHLPAPFILTAYRRGGRLLGWHITLVDGEQGFFFLEGHDAGERHVYFNLLVGVLQEAIAQGARSLDLGQTAEVPKTRLGATLVEKHLFATHPRAWARLALGAAKPLLEYRRQVPAPRVFRT